MIAQPNLLTEYQHLLQSEPASLALLNSFLGEREHIYQQICRKCWRRPAGAKRRNCLRKQLRSLVILADLLYMESRYQKIYAIRRSLVVTLDLIEKVNTLQEEPEPRVLLPKVLLDRARSKHRCSFAYLQEALGKLRIAPELICVSLMPLNNLFNTPEDRFYTYRDLVYLEHYLAGLLKLDLDSWTYHDAERLFCNALVRLNFNKMAFVDFCIGGIKTRLGGCCSLKEKLRILREEKARLIAIDAGDCIAYDHRLKGARSLLLTWLAEESRKLRKAAKAS